MVGGLDELRAELVRIRSAFLLTVVILACSDGQAASTAGSLPQAEPAVVIGVVDSIIPSDVALARFVAGLPVTTALEGGAPTTRQLVSRFLEALSKRDRAAIAEMIVSRAEYGFLYYPASVYSRKPYELSPDVAWMLSSESNAKGAGRLIDRLSGRPLKLVEFKCGMVAHEGLNTIHSDCRITYADASGKSESRTLFQSIIEREGNAKFLSYSGDF